MGEAASTEDQGDAAEFCHLQLLATVSNAPLGSDAAGLEPTPSANTLAATALSDATPCTQAPHLHGILSTARAPSHAGSSAPQTDSGEAPGGGGGGALSSGRRRKGSVTIVDERDVRENMTLNPAYGPSVLALSESAPGPGVSAASEGQRFSTGAALEGDWNRSLNGSEASQAVSGVTEQQDDKTRTFLHMASRQNSLQNSRQNSRQSSRQRMSVLPSLNMKAGTSGFRCDPVCPLAVSACCKQHELLQIRLHMCAHTRLLLY